MLEWKFHWFSLRFTFSFFAVIGLICAIDNSVQLRLCVIILCSLMHELGHLTAICIFGMRPESLTFCACGIRLSENALNCSKPKITFILLSGCAVDFISAGISILLGCSGVFAAVHLILGVFNLLPFRFFDGGRLYYELTGKEASMTIKIVALIFLGTIGLMSVMNGNIPFSLMATAVVLIADG